LQLNSQNNNNNINLDISDLKNNNLQNINNNSFKDDYEKE